jgi:hypothetical protein
VKSREADALASDHHCIGIKGERESEREREKGLEKPGIKLFLFERTITLDT